MTGPRKPHASYAKLRLRRVDPVTRESAYLHTLLLDYGRGGHQFYVPSRLVRDYLKLLSAIASFPLYRANPAIMSVEAPPAAHNAGCCGNSLWPDRLKAAEWSPAFPPGLE
jgi:hypothetical protein